MAGHFAPVRRPVEAAPSPRRWQPLAVALLLGAMVGGGLWIFGRGLDNRFVSDDWVFLYQAVQVQAQGNWQSLLALDGGQFYRPLQRLTTALLYQLFGLTTAPYHLASLWLHCLNAALVFAFARRLASAARLARRPALTLATATALLFWLNWRHHEAILWYSSISEPLAATLRLTTLLLVMAWLRRRPVHWGTYGLSVVTGGLALLAKESAAALPLEVLFVLWYGHQTHTGRWSARATALAWVPFAVMLALWLSLYLASAGQQDAGSVQRSGLAMLQATPGEWALRFIQYLDGHYLGGTVLAQNTPLLAAQLAGLAVVGALAVRARRWLWLFALAWTLAAVSPNVAIVPEEVVMRHLPVLAVGVFGDRYLYYSSAGAGLLLAASLEWLGSAAHGWLAPRWGGVGWLAAGALVAGLLGANAARLYGHELDWDTAGRYGQAIIDRAIQGVGKSNGNLCLVDLPDNYRGKYIFRNGFGPALALARPEPGPVVRVLTEAERATPPAECGYVLELPPAPPP